MTGLNNTVKAGLVLTAAALLGGCVAHAHPRPVTAVAVAPSGTVYVKTAPPKHRPHFARPARPGPSAVWIDGRWKWNGQRHVWVRGYWAPRPHARSHWVAGRWKHTPHGWQWRPGRWR